MSTDKVTDHMTKMYDEAMALADLEPAALEAAIVTAMKQSFRDVIAGSSGKLFEDTGVTMPGDHVWERYAKAALSAISARSVPEAGKVVVKPLVWEAREKPDLNGNRYWRAQTTFDWGYRIYFEDSRYVIQGGDKDFATLDEAKAAAQADYEQRALSALASAPAPSGAEPAAWMVLRKGNLHLPVLTSKEDAVRYQQYNPEETLQPLYASPQAVLAEDVAGQPIGFAYRDAQWMDEGRWHLCKTEPNAIKGRKVETVFLGSFVGSLAARLEASEAETTSLLHRLDMLQADFNDCNSVRASLRRKLEEHRKMLAEARERINRYADTAAEHDLVARIDALAAPLPEDSHHGR